MMLIAWVFVAIRGKNFVSLDAESIETDGYAAQVAFIQEVVLGGGNILQLKPLYWIHGARAAIALMFSFFEQLGGAWLVGLVFCLLMRPLVRIFAQAKKPIVGIVLPIAMMALSYRSVLVVMAVGYLILYIRYNEKPWVLIISILFANLSSGAVLAVFLITLFVGLNYRRHSFVLKIYASLACASLVISLQDKILGFLSGDAGYDSTIQGATGVVALLSRSTIFVSFAEGNVARGLVYVFLLFVALVAIGHAVGRYRYGAYIRIFLLTLPAFFLEGLGVLALLFPAAMFVADISFPLKQKRAFRFAAPSAISHSQAMGSKG